jgi:hypothetical protein
MRPPWGPPLPGAVATGDSAGSMFGAANYQTCKMDVMTRYGEAL